MNARRYLFLIFLIVPILVGGGLAIGGTGDPYEGSMMGDDMMDGCMKDGGTMHHRMGKPMMMDDMPMHRMNPWRYLRERLNLTDEQANKFRRLHMDYRKEVLKRRAGIEIEQMELVELLRSKGSNEKAIEEKVNKLGSLKTDLNLFRVKTLLKAREFLSEDQYEELTNFIMGWMRPYRMWWGMPWRYGWDDEE